MILPIYLDSQPILREKTNPVDIDIVSSEDIQKFILSMTETMHNAKGIGLAAPQVGSKHRICIVSYDIYLNEQDKDQADKIQETTVNNSIVLINPQITKKSFSKSIYEEGCLSIPGIYGTVKRPKNIKISYTDINGKEVDLKATGFFSRVIQHEVDHLDGVLFTDKVIKYISEERVNPNYPYIK